MIGRRAFIAALVGFPFLGRTAWAADPRDIEWADLLPEGIGYAPIVAVGHRDEANDIWRPKFGEGANAVEQSLDGQFIKLAGFMVPLDFTSEGTRSFLLAPFAGACIHVPPPPNQIVYATSETAVPFFGMMQPVRVTGRLTVETASTSLAAVGYTLRAEDVEKHAA